MPYQFALERPDYSDLASGRVLYSGSGFPAFPVRLASEILQRCLAWRAKAQRPSPCVLYDPCCGAGYLLTVLGFLHGSSLSAVIGSDVDETALGLARRNLGLRSLEGLDARIAELSDLYQRYQKESHRAALVSAHRLRSKLAGSSAVPPLRTSVFQADALDGPQLAEKLGGVSVDIVLVDVPYGLHSYWRQRDRVRASSNPLSAMLEALSGMVGPTSLVAVVSDKGQKASHAGYTRLEQFQIGKRRVVIGRLEGKA